MEGRGDRARVLAESRRHDREPVGHGLGHGLGPGGRCGRYLYVLCSG